MKLFVIASLIAISAAARLEHLERSYLPPNQGSFGSNSGSHGSFGANSGSHGSFGDNSGSHGSFGANSGTPGSFGANSGSHGSFGANSGSHGGFGANSGSNGGFGANSGSNGALGANSGSHGSFGANSGSFGATNGFGSSAGRPGVNAYNGESSFAAATSNQYLPPDQGSAASIGTPQFGGSLQGNGNQRYQAQQYTAPQPSNSFGQNQYTIPSTQYGTPQGPSFGSSQGSSSFGAQTSGSRYQTQSNQFGAASRQYLAPKATPPVQNGPQQSFDEETGYHY